MLKLTVWVSWNKDLARVNYSRKNKTIMQQDEIEITIPNRIKKHRDKISDLLGHDHTTILEQLLQSELVCMEALNEYKKTRADLRQIKEQTNGLYKQFGDGSVFDILDKLIRQLEKHHEILSMLLSLMLMRKNTDYDEKKFNTEVMRLLSSVKSGINIKTLQNRDIDGDITVQEI